MDNPISSAPFEHREGKALAAAWDEDKLFPSGHNGHIYNRAQGEIFVPC
jgi:hypothetical protein